MSLTVHLKVLEWLDMMGCPQRPGWKILNVKMAFLLGKAREGTFMLSSKTQAFIHYLDMHFLSGQQRSFLWTPSPNDDRKTGGPVMS